MYLAVGESGAWAFIWCADVSSGRQELRSERLLASQPQSQIENNTEQWANEYGRQD